MDHPRSRPHPLPAGRFALGVNYWASHAATEMWSRWDEQVVDDDLRALAAQGVGLLRVFPLWPDFQPIKRLYFGDNRPAEFRLGEERLPDTELGQAGMSELMMERFARFCDLAARHGQRLIVALLTGQMTGRLFMPAGLAGLDPINDPAALLWERRFIHAFVRRMRGHDAIAAWNFGNEINCLGKPASREALSFWMGAMADAIRLEDPERPLISGMDGFSERQTDDSPQDPQVRWTVRRQAEHCDLLATHHYVMWKQAGSDPCDTLKPCLAPSAESLAVAGIAGKPVFVEEIGLNWRPSLADHATLAAYVRTNLWNLWAEDCRGLLWWCAFDQENQRMAPYDWEWAGLEHGILSSARAPRPAAAELARFRAHLDRLPFATLPPRERQAVVLLGDARQRVEGAVLGAYLLARQAGFAVDFQQAGQPLKPARLYLLPSATGRCGLSPATWDALRAAVRAGADLYLSGEDLYLDGLAEVTGAEVVHRTGRPGTYRFDLALADGPCTVALPLRHLAAMAPAAPGTRVLGRGADGDPVFFSAPYGAGTVHRLGVPLEAVLVETPMAFHDEAARDAWRIYAHIARSILASRVAVGRNPHLLLSEHRRGGDDGGEGGEGGEVVVVAVNARPQAVADRLALQAGWALASWHGEGVAVAAADGGGGLAVSVPANGGAVLVLRRARP